MTYENISQKTIDYGVTYFVSCVCVGFFYEFP